MTDQVECNCAWNPDRHADTCPVYMQQRIEALRAEIEELDTLRNRQSDLLSQTAIAVRGPEPALTRYSHADIPSRVKAVVADLEAVRGLLSGLIRAVRSINCTPRHAIMIKGDDEPCFWQRREWVEYVLGLCTEAEAALTATTAPKVRPDLIRFDFINADGQPDSKMITHDDMRERYNALYQQSESSLEREQIALAHAHDPMPVLDDDLRYILGRPNFWCYSLANAMRAMGQEIARKAEEEQAAVIHWLLKAYFEHGPGWRDAVEKILAAEREKELAKGGEQ
ncbi:hypothetical protein [Pseudomonas sp. UBA7530]|uniref:hypothetical protein n=1 Tax=Pseudomonas sp. UBA7530 TaxID=1947341 RepID=UPI0025EB5686|nr:hypothetical protein [Pseudomonas sp. UBA7530]